jgi:hypothetical protein
MPSSPNRRGGSRLRGGGSEADSTAGRAPAPAPAAAHRPQAGPFCGPRVVSRIDRGERIRTIAHGTARHGSASVQGWPRNVPEETRKPARTVGTARAIAPMPPRTPPRPSRLARSPTRGGPEREDRSWTAGVPGSGLHLPPSRRAASRYAANCASVSSTESPANFARNARATSKAITFSRTTLAAAAAQMSERS